MQRSSRTGEGVCWRGGAAYPAMRLSHRAMATAGEARLCWGMDAETKDYLDGILGEILTAMNAGFSRLERRQEALEQRIEALEQRMDAMELRFDERFQSLGERFATMELRIEQFEVRVTGRLDSLDARTKQLEVRTGSIEQNLLNLNTRMDVLSDDMRQRFRVLNDRLAGAA